jgi:L-alanine-DL-glutamate epimerase-like enolase superfamily enzyme
MGRASDIRVLEARLAFADYRYRTPIKFGGKALDRATILNVAIEAESRAGSRATGFGSMPLGNVWAFPSKTLSYDETLAAMKGLAERIARIIPESCAEFAYPIDHGVALEDCLSAESAQVDTDLNLSEPMPMLAALVAASPFDAALHDAFGKASGMNCYHGYGREFVENDLSAYLDARFAGEYLDRYTLAEPRPTLPLYHLVGALDALTGADLRTRIGDGLPETLMEWIAADGLTHLKIKLNGDNLDWDVERVLAVDRVAREAEGRFGARQWRYSLDFNEQCRSVEYLMEFMARVNAKEPQAFAKVQYIEQPTARNLRANPANKMHAAAKVKPVVIDESLVDYESLLLAQEMGYTGVALKACKGQTQSLILGAAAQKLGLFLCVQDLTCTGPSFLHSASLASHIPGVAAVEGNGRQYCPAANKGWEDLFPTVFKVRDGMIETAALAGPGLGCVPDGCAPEGLEESGR